LSVRELDKLVDVYELSERFKKLREPGAAITWARELTGVSKKLLSPSVIDTVIDKVNEKRITNSKDLRKLRAILRDPVAKAHFLTDEGDVESALLRIAPEEPARSTGLAAEVDAVMEAIRRTPWTQLEELRGDQGFMKKLEDAEGLLRSLRKTISA